MARTGDLAGLQGFLDSLVGNSSLRGLAYIQGFLDEGGDGEGGFPPRLAWGNKRCEEVMELLPPFVSRFVDHGIRENIIFIKFPRNLGSPGELAPCSQGEADFPDQPFLRNRSPVLRGHVGTQKLHPVLNGVMGGANSGGQAREKGERQQIHER